MSASMNHMPRALEMDDLRELMRSVAETTERLEATHVALQNQVARLQQELSEANAQLRRARSLAALGEMAAGIAHEIRNPLGSIQLYVQVLADELRDRPEQEKLCQKIERAVVGLDAIVRDVLSFARETTIQPRATSVQELFQRALNGCESLLSGVNISVRRDIDKNCWLEADAGLMTQALVNLIRNAVEAMQGSAAGDSHHNVMRLAATKRVVRCPEGKQSVRVVLSVEDSGPGIAPEVVERMFNPFFTTRKTGTGLGLAIVHRIVDAHGGHINVKSVAPHGARIEICLPARQTTLKAEMKPTAASKTGRRVMEVVK